jgi:hypothetical protein
MDRIRTFGTALRDGEQSPSADYDDALNKLLVKRGKQVPEALTVAR